MPKLQAPENGVAVRMYRQGHGDCFLLAFPRKGGGDPVYVLIDCGYKPGSPDFIHKRAIGDTIDHISESTGDRLDLVIITHEHQDHLNGIWKKSDPYFGRFDIKEAWMAWTENPEDELANELRRRHKDTLLSLIEGRKKLALAVAVDDPTLRRVDSLLSLEFGGEDDTFAADAMSAAAKDPTKSVNKQALKLIKDKAALNRGVSYLNPGDGPIEVPNSGGVRAFVFGPPRNADLLGDEDPIGSEGFPQGNGNSFTFGAAAGQAPTDGLTPFSPRFVVPFDDATRQSKPFFSAHYGTKDAVDDDSDRVETPSNAKWRQIDDEWLFSAESLALTLNKGINNTSLVLAFELPKSKKVLFFVGDAQRGNWISWKDIEWKDGATSIKPRDLLARTVLYKVGHHGSHNATLAGNTSDDYVNLSWMATGAAAKEFTAMITAVNEWALTKNSPPWKHPLPSIKAALTSKAQGRVFQTDEDKPAQQENVPDGTWKAFTDRSTFEQLHFDYRVIDE